MRENGLKDVERNNFEKGPKMGVVKILLVHGCGSKWALPTWHGLSPQITKVVDLFVLFAGLEGVSSWCSSELDADLLAMMPMDPDNSLWMRWNRRQAESNTTSTSKPSPDLAVLQAVHAPNISQPRSTPKPWFFDVLLMSFV